MKPVTSETTVYLTSDIFWDLAPCSLVRTGVLGDLADMAFLIVTAIKTWNPIRFISFDSLFTCGLFNVAVMNADYTASNDLMTVNTQRKETRDRSYHGLITGKNCSICRYKLSKAKKRLREDCLFLGRYFIGPLSQHKRKVLPLEWCGL
jgi:hypothetical protein